MPINHDPNSEDFKMRVRAYIIFFQNIGTEKAAEFCVHQDATISGLQKNNDAFVVAYRKAAEQSVQPTASGVVWRARLAHVLITWAYRLIQNGGG